MDGEALAWVVGKTQHDLYAFEVVLVGVFECGHTARESARTLRITIPGSIFAEKFLSAELLEQDCHTFPPVTLGSLFRIANGNLEKRLFDLKPAGTSSQARSLFFRDASLLFGDAYLFVRDQSLSFGDAYLFLGDESLLFGDAYLSFGDRSLLLRDGSLFSGDASLSVGDAYLFVGEWSLLFGDASLFLRERGFPFGTQEIRKKSHS